jgi:hypothetical protein
MQKNHGREKGNRKRRKEKRLVLGTSGLSGSDPYQGAIGTDRHSRGCVAKSGLPLRVGTPKLPSSTYFLEGIGDNRDFKRVSELTRVIVSYKKLFVSIC